MNNTAVTNASGYGQTPRQGILTPAASSPGGPCKVLVVDSDPFDRRLVQRGLEGGRHSVLAVPTADEAVPYLGFHFDAIILSSGTGGISVDQLLDYIRFESPNCDTPVILVTDLPAIPDHLDIQAIVRKPLSLAELTAALDAVDVPVARGSLRGRGCGDED